MGFFAQLFGTEQPPANDLGMQAQPININPPADVGAARHAGRLSRLYGVAEPTDEMLAEIKQRCHALESKGHDAPNNAAEALALMAKLGG